MNRKKIGAIILTGLMVIGMGMTSYAEDNIQTPEGTAQIEKNLVFAEGIDTPAEEFSFSVTKITEDAPEAAIDSIVYQKGEDKGTIENGTYTVSKNADIQFQNEFPHAGVYEYKVKEEAGSASGITYSTEEYLVRVYVVNQEDGMLRIQSITAEKGDSKQEKISFRNTYVTTGNLAIEKKTEGAFADKTRSFEFTIEFIRSATNDSSVSYTGKIGNEDVVCVIGVPTTFELHDGQSINFADLPAGTRYIVTEKEEKDGYTPSVQAVENGVQGETRIGTDGADLSASTDGESSLVGEKDNKVTFTNTYTDVPITGVYEQKLPYILLLGISGILFLACLFLKKRMSLSK